MNLLNQSTHIAHHFEKINLIRNIEYTFDFNNQKFI